MPPGKRRQSNAMLYTLITFVALFVAATTVAVIYYVKAEELRTTAKDAQDDLGEMASSEEIRNVGAIIGTKLRGETNLGSMVQYFDQMTGLVMGTPVQETSAEVKISSLKDKTIDFLQKAESFVTLPPPDPNATDPALPDPNQVSLMTVMNDLLGGLQRTTNEKNGLTEDLAKLQQQFDDATTRWETTEQDLTANVEDYKQQVEQTKSDYADLRTLLEQSSEQQAANLLKQVEDLRTESRQLNQDLLRSQAELQMAQQRLADALDAIKKTQPDPDDKAVASIPDGKIILVDEAAGIVHINLGRENHIYRGLTFSVYDKASGVSSNDEPKAEIEVFSITEKTAAARITASKTKNPIATDDIVANLIWDADKSNQFIIVGSFDLNGDGKPDFDAKDRLAALIRKWGGTVADAVSAKTDYVIIGTEPVVPPQPTFEQLTTDPEAQTRYDRAEALAKGYNEIRDQAQTFYIPSITYERFLYLIGYRSQVGKPGAL